MSSERARLARELHDGIAQDLVAVGYSLDLLLADPETSTASRSQIRSLRFNVTDLISKVRHEIYFLSQSTSLNLAKRIEEISEKECADIALRFDINPGIEALDQTSAYEIDRIVHEILRNIAAHSGATEVLISLKHEEAAIELRIEDNGRGGAQTREGHFGLQSLESRAESIKAELLVSSDESGTRVLLRWPSAKPTDG